MQRIAGDLVSVIRIKVFAAEGWCGHWAVSIPEKKWE